MAQMIRAFQERRNYVVERLRQIEGVNLAEPTGARPAGWRACWPAASGCCDCGRGWPGPPPAALLLKGRQRGARPRLAAISRDDTRQEGALLAHAGQVGGGKVVEDVELR